MNSVCKAWTSVTCETKILFWSVAGAFLVYLGTAPVVASLAGESFGLAPVWSARVVYPLWSRPFVLMFGLSGVLVALFAPGVGWAVALAGYRLRAAALFCRAFVINLIQATALLTMWKAFTGTVPSRPVFIAWQALVAAAGLVVMFRSRRRGSARQVDEWRVLLIGALVLLLILPFFLWGKTFIEDASGDGNEAFEFSRSLAKHQLPHWDLENGYYGFYPSFMLFAYPTQLVFRTLGETDAAQRLPVYFYLLGIYLILAELIRSRRRRLFTIEVFLLVGAAVYFLVYNAHHATYELVADLAEPTGVDIFFTFLAASAFYALTTKQRFWWGITAFLGVTALPAGLPFAMLFLVGQLINFRFRLRAADLARDALAFLVPWVGYQLFVSLYSHFYPIGITKFAVANLFTRYSFRLDAMLAAGLAAKLALVVAIVPFIGLVFVVRRDRIVRRLGLVLAGYFAILVLFGRTNPHYLIPLGLIPTAMLLRSMAGSGIPAWVRSSVHLAYGAALVVLTILVLPSDRTPHSAYREFGARTLMLYDSYPSVVDATDQLVWRKPGFYVFLPDGTPAFPWQQPHLVFAEGETAAVLYPRQDGPLDRLISPQSTANGAPIPWGITHHVWVRYADRKSSVLREYSQILAAGHLAPQQVDGFVRRNLPGGWVLYFRPDCSVFARSATNSW
jgi:hypothetical protein